MLSHKWEMDIRARERKLDQDLARVKSDAIEIGDARATKRLADRLRHRHSRGSVYERIEEDVTITTRLTRVYSRGGNRGGVTGSMKRSSYFRRRRH